MQVGKARHARHVKHMRSRLQGARSHAVVDSNELQLLGVHRALGVHCAMCTGTIMGRSSWRTHCAGQRERDFRSAAL